MFQVIKLELYSKTFIKAVLTYQLSNTIVDVIRYIIKQNPSAFNRWKLIDHPSRNIFCDGSTKKFPSSDKKKVCLVKNLFFMYFT